VAIARALANEPALLLADEPTGGLDGESIERVLGLFRALRIQRPELTIIVVTHDPVVALAAERVVRLRAGRIDAAARALIGQSS
jgi:ABC-type lipoprotein export system ATPase subunit